MKRFSEDFTHLDGHFLQFCINETHLDGVWPDQYQKVILPYSLLNINRLYGRGNTRGMLDLNPPPRFDLVIVDEAHHIRNEDTANHKAVRYFCENAEAAVFLTATPIQLENRDLFVLLNTLRPDLIIDEEGFRHMSEPNRFINRAIDAARAQERDWMREAMQALKQAETTAWGQSILKNNPEFRRIQSQLSSETIADAERVRLITDIEALHTFSDILNRTRRRDIGEFTIRRPQTVEVGINPRPTTDS